MRETVLKSTHQALGARMVPFGGWDMPVQYKGILEEARIVRSAAGLFDLGHMGRVRVRGGDAEAFLQRLQTNDAAQIPAGRIRYAMILNEDGLTQDDILVYREPDEDGFFLVINAGNTDRDLGIMRALAAGYSDLELIDQTDELAMIAVQGPLSEAIVGKITDIDLTAVKYYAGARGPVLGAEAAVSRTGYTGEDGFEIYLPQDKAVEAWEALLRNGGDQGLEPCGLGSRDILRLEAGMPLYGHEIDETTTPLDAGLTFGVKFTHDFVGREALERIQAAGGPTRRLVGLETESRRVPRQGYPIVHGGETVGSVCSGGASPTRGKNIATAYVPHHLAEPGTELGFAIRDKAEPAVVVPLPFYKRAR
jgi:aminomethyltransferase